MSRSNRAIHWRESVGPSHIDKAIARSIEQQIQHGTFYGFTNQQREEIAAVGVEILAGKTIDYSKRAREIGARVALGSLGADTTAELTRSWRRISFGWQKC